MFRGIWRKVTLTQANDNSNDEVPPAAVRQGFVRCLVMLYITICSFGSASAEEFELPLSMLSDPSLQKEKVVTKFDPKLKQLWLTAIKHSDADVRRRAAYTITLARGRGMKGFLLGSGNDPVDSITPLQSLVESDGEDTLVRIEAARALIALNAKQSAPILLKLAQRDFYEFSVTVEPALVKWKFADAKDLWLRRLRGDQAHRTTQRLLAIRGLVAIGAKEATQPLSHLLQQHHTPATIKAAAALALSQLADPAELHALAKQFSQKSDYLNQLLVIHLLSRQKSPEALSQLRSAAQSGKPVLQAAALAALFELDRPWITKNALDWIHKRDPRIREVAIRAISVDDSPVHLRMLASRLNDNVRRIRQNVRLTLERYAKKEVNRKIILDRVSKSIRDGSFRWPGLEQGSILIARLSSKKHAMLLVPLIDHDQTEVAHGSSWALSQLAVPATLPEIIRRSRELILLTRGGNANIENYSIQLTYLVNTFGKVKDPSTLPLLMQMLQRNPQASQVARAAAVWCLGKYYEGQKNEALCKEIDARFNDIHGPRFNESGILRAMCAIALARINTKVGQSSLVEFSSDKTLLVRTACFWALNKRTGQKIPPLPIKRTEFDDWFIQRLGGNDDQKK